MPQSKNSDVSQFIGSKEDDQIVDGYQNDDGKTLQEQLDAVDKVNGHAGDDTISTGEGNDLAAGDMVGDEWSFVDGKWIYDPEAVVISDLGSVRSFDDEIRTGKGDDVLLGNGGHDTLYSGDGDDTINAGTGSDKAFAGSGDDLVNLEEGNDFAEGGLGDDTVNAGDGDDVVYGDLQSGNILNSSEGMTSFKQYEESGAWTMTDVDGQSSISQSANTKPGETYTISFELAANLSAGHSSAKVEVLWNGEVVDVVEASSGIYETFEVDVQSTGNEGSLSFRTIETAPGGQEYDFSGPVVSYEKGIELAGENVTVDAFAPGQATLYQVIDGQLKSFDTTTKEYVDVGPSPGFKINAVGFNVEDDLIYGIAKSNGVDALGNAIKSTDIVMIDASGAAYRVGDGFYGDYVGDFDDNGNLWTFQSSLNRISVVDVDNPDANGDPQITHFDLENDLFKDRTYDIAYNSEDGNFYAVISPAKNGAAGKVVKIDLSEVENGGAPKFDEVPITGTLYGDTMQSGMAKGAYGAVFLDGDGNLYYGLNRGDHDLEASTDSQGAIFKVNVDWDSGQAYSEFMAEAQSTGSNDGTVDPRSADSFAEVDAEAPVLLRNPELAPEVGGNDDLRGGAGDDEMYGNAGDDTLHGGSGQDTLSGDEGRDIINAGTGNDVAHGGEGDDKIQGEAGNDMLSGGDGRDYLAGGTGNDVFLGGAGGDKLVGGTGSDTIEGGTGNDHMWGGQWRGDNDADTFIVAGGNGSDMIHDFEVDHDQIDLSAYGVEFSDLQGVMKDKGWATEIDLSALSGGVTGDKLILKSVDVDDLDESNFIL